MWSSGKITLEQGLSQSALLKLRRDGAQKKMCDVEDNWRVIFTSKESDYEYKSYVLSSGRWVDAMDVPMTYVQLSANGKEILKEGPSFQLVFFVQ